jgi:hypothetical protein
MNSQQRQTSSSLAGGILVGALQPSPGDAELDYNRASYSTINPT